MMAANVSDAEEQSKKRIREGDQEKYARKRYKREKVILPAEVVSICHYFSLSSLELLSDDQLEIWSGIKKSIVECFPSENKGIDDYSLIAHVPPSVLLALQRMKYTEMSLDTLDKTLHKYARFIQILSQLKPSKKSDVEHEALFTELRQYIEEGIVELTESSGWNVIHIAACHGRIDLLIAVQRHLLPKQPTYYESLLQAETSTAHAKAIDFKKNPHYDEFFILTNEQSFLSLKEKQFAVILKMLVANKEESQCGALYDQLKQLIAEDVDFTVTEPTRGLTILHHAVYKRDVDLVRHILQYASLEQCKKLFSTQTNNTKSTAFSIAECYEHEEILSLLRKKQSEIFKEESVVIFNELKKIRKIKDKDLLYRKIEKFIKEGGDPTVTSDNGWNFLHYAAHFGALGLVELVRDTVSPEQYEKLLSIKTKGKGVTPIDMALNRKEKGDGNSEMLRWFGYEEVQNALHSPRPSRIQTLFFKPAMCLTELCQRLNECIAELGHEFIKMEKQTVSGEEQFCLCMPYFTHNEEKIDHFIGLLRECSLEASKNNSDPERPVVMVEGVKDKALFLQKKGALIHFANEYVLSLTLSSTMLDSP